MAGPSGFVSESGVAVRLKTITNGYQLTDESDNVETYDATGKLLSIADRAGNLQTLTYAGPGGALSSVSDNFGHSLSLGYDGSNRLHTVIGPDGPVQYDYDAAGHLWKIANTDGSSHQFLYQDSRWPNGISSRIDENSQTNLLWQYDTQGRVTSAKLGGIATGMGFVYNANGTTTETDPLGATHTFAAQQIGNHMLTTGVTGDPCVPCGFSKAISYDTGGFPASVTDYNDNVTQYTYDDARGLELSRTEAHTTLQARTVTTAWHPTYRLPMQIDEYAGKTATGTPLRSTLYTYDQIGNLLTESIRDGASGRTRTTTYSNYTAQGQPQTIDGPRTDIADVTQRAYYPIIPGDPKSGQLQTITDALSHTQTFNDYDDSGRPLQITDANGLITLLGYDTRGRLHTTQVGSQLTTLDYWPTSQLKRVALPSGATLDYVYNAAHELTDITDQLGEHIHITPDAVGNAIKTEVFDAGGTLVQTHSRQFNVLNQLAADIGAYNNESTLYTYDGNGNLKTIADPLLHKTTNGYDALDRLSKITDPKLYDTLFGLNTLDQLTAVTDPRQLATTYTLDGLDNLGRSVSPDTGTTKQLLIDDAGNVLQRQDAKKQLTNYQYDALNRLIRITRGDSSVVSFGYDQNDAAHGFGIGRLTSMTDASGSTDWMYDLYGHVTRTLQTTGTVTLRTRYSYDGPTGHLLSMTLPSSKVITYTWTSGQITGLTLNGSALVSNIVYQPFSGPKSWLHANGETGTRAYDLNGRITGDPIETIGYDAAGRIKTLTLGNRSAIAGNQVYDYDELDRVISYTGTGGPITYAYDANGNRSSTIVAGTATTSTIGSTSNQLNKTLTGTIKTTYGYDANGSRITRNTDSTTYDAAGRLTAYATTGTNASYAYNGTGARVQKTVNGTVTLFAYDEAGHLIGDYNAAGNAMQETIYLGDMPVSVLRGTKVYAVHADYRNTPRQLDDATQTAVWTWTPLPFGENNAVSNPFIYNLRFPGQYYDSESGLFQNGFRDYEPASGKYLESDPIGLSGGVNTYTYSKNNPLSFTDPTGLVPNVLEAACLAGPNPACIAGVLADAITNVVAIVGVTAVVGSVAGSTDNAREKAITAPGKPKRGVTCTCRAASNGLQQGNCPDDEFAFGTATAPTYREARAEAERLARQKLGKQAKHTQCKCTDQNGNRMY